MRYGELNVELSTKQRPRGVGICAGFGTVITRQREEYVPPKEELLLVKYMFVLAYTPRTPRF